VGDSFLHLAFQGGNSPLCPSQLRMWYDILYCRGFQPFSDHVSL